MVTKTGGRQLVKIRKINSQCRAMESADSVGILNGYDFIQETIFPGAVTILLGIIFIKNVFINKYTKRSCRRRDDEH